MSKIRCRFYDKIDNNMKFTEGVFNKAPLGIQDLSKPMLYAELNDKKGMKIYEGDICKGVTKYSKKKFENCKVCFMKGTIMCGSIPLFNCINLEIIGNIYENPELLKGK